jgi:hypothetical protein
VYIFNRRSPVVRLPRRGALLAAQAVTMNRAQRRRQRSATRIRALQRRVEETGLPGVVDGLTGACRDCTGGGQFILLPGHRIIARVFHDDHCPTFTGVTRWAPVPDDGT